MTLVVSRISHRSFHKPSGLFLRLCTATLLLLFSGGCERDADVSSEQGSWFAEVGQASASVGTPPPAPVDPQPIPSAPAERAAVEGDEPAPPAPEVDAERSAWLPLADATAGEWAEYETLDGRILRYDVLDTSPLAVKTRLVLRESGRAVGEPATREDDPAEDRLAREARRRQAVRSMHSATVRVAGRQWEATLYEDRWTDEDVQYIRRTWVYPQVPYLGVLRMELHGDDQLEARLILRNYGRR